MRKAAFVLVLLLSVAAVGCVRQPSTEQKVHKSLAICRQAILETTKMVEVTHQNGLITTEKYNSAVQKIMLVVNRYNVALRLVDGPTEQDVQTLLSDLALIREAL